MSIDIGDDILDSRDIIKRIDELESEIEDLESEHEEFEDKESDEAVALFSDIEDLQEELDAWRLFEDAGAPDWPHGEQFINDTYFEEYAKQFANDVGAVNEDAGWPNQHIDWEAAAQDLQQDYMAVEVDTYTYWVRG